MNMPLTKKSIKIKIFLEQQVSMVPAIVPSLYLLGTLYHLDERQLTTLAIRWATPILTTLGIIGPYLVIHFFTEGALRSVPGEPAGARLRRILLLPRRIEMGTTTSYLVGVAGYTLAACLTYGRPLALVGAAVLVCLALYLLMNIRQTLRMEDVLRPLAVEEMERHPEVRVGGGGFLWPRQVWYRPYVTLIIIFATVVALGVILIRRLEMFLGGLDGDLRGRGYQSLAAELPEWGERFLDSLLPPTAIILGFVLLLGAITSRAVAKRQRSGAQAVETAARAMASGTHAFPAWPATDELGDLAFATAAAVAALQRRELSIGTSAHTLEDVARELTALVSRQQQVITTQASVLQQAQVTAREIKETSTLASEKAERVLSAAEGAEKVGRSGRTAIESSLEQLSDILLQVREMASHITRLDDRAKKIGRITLVVKDLADQSNMVALNAAIEATRAGESGKAFSVVAQQIRRLGNESMAATDQVQQVLHDVVDAIGQTVRLSGAGIDRAGSGMELTKACGEDIRKLTEITEDNASAARQICLAVTQQGAGIAQIFEALRALETTMGETVDSMKATEAITGRAQRAAQEVASAMSQKTKPLPA